MEYHMREEKIEQNVERLNIFISHTLGCSDGDALEIIFRLLKKRIRNRKGSFKG